MKRQAGFFIPAVLIAMSIASMVAGYYGVKYYRSQITSLRDNGAQMVGGIQRQIGISLGNYVSLFQKEIQGNGSSSFDVNRNGYTVPASRVRAPTTSDLVSLGLLRSELSQPVRYGNQTINYIITLTVDTSTGCSVPNCNIRTLVRTDSALIDPDTNDIDIRRINIAAFEASPSNAGISLPTSPANFVGKDGNIVTANPTSIAGLVGLIDGYDSQGLEEFYRRDGTKPLTADFQAAGFNLKNVGSGDFSGNITTSNGNITAANGGISAPNGTVYGNNVYGNAISGNSVTGNSISSNGGIVATNDITSTNGNVSANGQVQGDTLLPRATVVENSWCGTGPNDIGKIAKDAAGTQMICKGIWKSNNGAVTGGSNWVQFPNGTIMQWGKSSICGAQNNGGNSGWMNFPVPFPSGTAQTLQATLTGSDPGWSTWHDHSVRSYISGNSAYFWVGTPNNGGNSRCYGIDWFATGN